MTALQEQITEVFGRVAALEQNQEKIIGLFDELMAIPIVALPMIESATVESGPLNVELEYAEPDPLD